LNNSGIVPTPPTPEEQREMIRGHFDEFAKAECEYVACRRIRKIAIRYGHGMKNIKKFRVAITKIKTRDEFNFVLDNIFPLA